MSVDSFVSSLSKRELRDEIRRRLLILPPEQFMEEGARIVIHITNHEIWQQYKTVFLFLSMEHEIDTAPLLSVALAADKQVFVPQIRGKDLRFCRIFSVSGPWVTGSLGIREPAGNFGKLPGRESFPALFFVPALAFDRGGMRLGRGKGYYDRFFAGLDRTEGGSPAVYFTIGLCLETQVLPQLPADTWDKPMNALCTGKGFIPILGGKS